MKRQLISSMMVIVMISFMVTSCSSIIEQKEKSVPESSNNAPVTSNDSFDDEEIPGDTVDLEDDPFLQERETNDIRFEQEMEDAKIERVRTDASHFIGKWTATSDQAIFLYGNIDLIVTNGSWTADITGEKLGGQWKVDGDHAHFDDNSEIDFDFDLAFDNSGALIMTETNPDGIINTVLTKVN